MAENHHFVAMVSDVDNTLLCVKKIIVENPGSGKDEILFAIRVGSPDSPNLLRLNLNELKEFHAQLSKYLERK